MILAGILTPLHYLLEFLCLAGCLFIAIPVGFAIYRMIQTRIKPPEEPKE